MTALGPRLAGATPGSAVTALGLARTASIDVYNVRRAVAKEESPPRPGTPDMLAEFPT